MCKIKKYAAFPYYLGAVTQYFFVKFEIVTNNRRDWWAKVGNKLLILEKKCSIPFSTTRVFKNRPSWFFVVNHLSCLSLKYWPELPGLECCSIISTLFSQSDCLALFVGVLHMPPWICFLLKLLSRARGVGTIAVNL